MKCIPYSHQSIDSKDIAEVVNVLKGDWITQGPKIDEFEKALASYCKAKYAVAVNSGTSALHIACLAAGIQKGDEVITSPISFVASANCVLYCGGKPVFADVEEKTANVDPKEIEKKITKKTRAIIPVHFSGFPFSCEKIYNIARKHQLTIIEDACHALGAEYKFKNRWLKIGCCEHSDMAIASFHPVKTITTGEGGAILTNRKDLYEKLRMLRTHGITNIEEQMLLKEQAADNENHFLGRKNQNTKAPWYYEMQMLGFNYRITDIQCALGLSQLKKVDNFVAKRKALAERYNKAFSKLPMVQIPPKDLNRRSSWHLYVLRICLDKISGTRREFFEKLRALKIGVQIHYIPVHLQPFYRKKFGFRRGDCPKAESYYDRAISIPLFPKLSHREHSYIIDVIVKIFTEISKRRRTND